MKIPFRDLAGMAVLFSVILVGSALRCAQYLPQIL